MPRLMSFAKTTNQIREQTKTVTRRDAWKWLEPGTVLWACKKTMGLKKGEMVEKICKIEVVDVRRERVDAVLCDNCGGDGLDPDSSPNGRCVECHGTGADPYDDVEREGFVGTTGAEFVEFFEDELGVAPDDEITRIEFRYLEKENDE